MGLFSSIGETIKEKYTEMQESKKQDKELLHRMRLEAREQERRIFQEEFRQNALEVAKAKAKHEAAKASGLKKLRAMNRLRNLSSKDGGKPSFFQSFSEYTQKNLAKREENLKKTQELREEARRQREQKLAEQRRFRQQRMQGRKGFN